VSGTGESKWFAELAALLPGQNATEASASFARRAPASYRELTSPEEAAHDLSELHALTQGVPSGSGEPTGGAFGGRHRLVVRPATPATGTFRIRRFAHQVPASPRKLWFGRRRVGSPPNWTRTRG